jgi:hypothetical protein
LKLILDEKKAHIKITLALLTIFLAAAAVTAFGEPALSADRRITMSDTPAQLLAELQNEWQRKGYRWSPDSSPTLIYLFNDALPELQFELPQVLIGHFKLVTNGASRTLFIFPNNKYILFEEKDGHTDEIIYGYIINIDDAWRSSDEPQSDLGPRFRGLGRIHLDESGFLFSGQRAMRKEEMPVPAPAAEAAGRGSPPAHLAQGISVTPWTKAKREYYTFGNSGDDTVDFYEMEEFPDDFSPSFPFFRLSIDNGIVRIVCLWVPGEFGEYFDGFIDIIEETADCLKGIIRFTNGTPYYYIDSGTAEITINNSGSITITMMYTPDPKQRRTRPIFDEFKFPAKLTLEF